MEQVCQEENVVLDRKSLLVSMMYSIATFRRTPVFFVNGVLVSQGRVPSKDELRYWIRQERFQEEVA